MKIRELWEILTSKETWKSLKSREFWKYFFVALGTISSIVTLVSFVFQLKNPCWVIVVIYIIFVLLLSCVFALWQTWRKKSIEIKVSNNLLVKVFAGDLFDYAKDENFVVIPVNEYFDTLVDNTIIHESTVHGQFVNKYYAEDHTVLHEAIKAFFDENGIEGEPVERKGSAGYRIKYPLGTCAVINKDGCNFVLLALTHFDENDHAFLELSELGRSISLMTKSLAGRVGSKGVYMPLMGMGMSRLNQTAQFILKYTLDTMMGFKKEAIPGGINIVVYPPVAETINLNEINY